jgi:FkbM family methyltransferase
MRLLTKLKIKIKVIFGRISNLKPNFIVNKIWFGNNYGGFYICPNSINENSIIYSFGVGEDISFDLQLIKTFNCTVYAFDPTPKSIKWVELINAPVNFQFTPIGIDDKSDFVEFLLPLNDNNVSGSIIHQSNVDFNKKIIVEMKALNDIIQIYNHKKIDILKMDIEGSEYKVLNNILETDVEINQILIEIHERFFLDGKEKTKKLITLLNKHSYKLFAVSDTKEELSFIKI